MELGASYQTQGRGIALIRAAGAAFTQTTRGLSTAVTRTGAGVYVVTLLTPSPASNCKTTLTIQGAVAAFGSVTHTSDTVKTVTTFTAAADAAADVDFDVSFEQLD